MSDSTIHISDYSALLDLRASLRNNADQLMMTVQDVSAHLDSVIATMQQKVAILQREANEAHRRLEEAERELSDCEASQRYDEEDGCYYPSCSMEAAAVSSARSDYDNCRRRLEEAERIVSDSSREVEKWHEPIGMLTPGGGYAVMEYLCGTHTEKALEKLSDIIDAVEEILATPVTLSGRAVEAEQIREMATETVSEEQHDRRREDYTEKFTEAEERVRSMARGNEFRKATGLINQLMEGESDLCERCHRPRIACICARDQREMERDRGQIWEILKARQR